MRNAALARFYRLLQAECGAHVFNPWTQRDPGNDGSLNGPEQRLERLRAHLAIDARRILIGEASGYQGCHVSGIPFTSERVILAGQVPRVRSETARLSLRHIPWSEPSATTMWGTLHALGIAQSTVLWNAFAWHPHEPGRLQSNRTPSRSERVEGLAALAALLEAFPKAELFAVGRHAQLALDELGRSATPLRHPSMGGARRFCEGLRTAIERQPGVQPERTPARRASGSATENSSTS
ncbi:MAG TPA: uracil-DNA glycosylase [Steroidobacteraceae bacterium]|nr:uracil-DNA glycosylase [Steroidobacteraceae bacterium]